MSGLLDVAGSEFVTVGDKQVEVFGVSWKGLASLSARFPAFGLMLNGGDVGSEHLMGLAQDALGALIAAGCGMLGDEAAEKHAERLSANVQTDLIAAILRRTIPDGPGPFVDKLIAAQRIAAGSSETLSKAPSTT
jgi:hypothetical protein